MHENIDCYKAFILQAVEMHISEHIKTIDIKNKVISSHINDSKEKESDS